MKIKMKSIFWLGAVAILSYEAYALVTEEEGDTISEKLWNLSRRPLVPFCGGMLAGHFWWQSQDVYDGRFSAKKTT